MYSQDSLIKTHFTLFILLAVNFQLLRKFVANKFGTPRGTSSVLYLFFLQIKKIVQLCNDLRRTMMFHGRTLLLPHLLIFMMLIQSQDVSSRQVPWIDLNISSSWRWQERASVKWHQYYNPWGKHCIYVVWWTLSL